MARSCSSAQWASAYQLDPAYAPCSWPVHQASRRPQRGGGACANRRASSSSSATPATLSVAPWAQVHRCAPISRKCRSRPGMSATGMQACRHSMRVWASSVTCVGPSRHSTPNASPSGRETCTAGIAGSSARSAAPVGAPHSGEADTKCRCGPEETAIIPTAPARAACAITAWRGMPSTSAMHPARSVSADAPPRQSASFPATPAGPVSGPKAMPFAAKRRGLSPWATTSDRVGQPMKASNPCSRHGMPSACRRSAMKRQAACSAGVPGNFSPIALSAATSAHRRSAMGIRASVMRSRSVRKYARRIVCPMIGQECSPSCRNAGCNGMRQVPATSYDQVPYPTRPVRLTHPARMAVAAHLLGLPYAPPERCRVLEIGCGDGANLIPMAVALPESRFEGFDLSPAAVLRGQAIIQRLGLRNIALRCADILTVEVEPAAFDYVIAHGVYAWVPAPVRAALLRLAGACLTPDGIAFVSYNALPGCYLRKAVRDMLLRRLDGIGDPNEQLAAAYALLRDFAAGAPDQTPSSAALKLEVEEILKRPPRVLFHDELNPVWEPQYVSDVLAASRAHGLEFLAESEGVLWCEDDMAAPLCVAARGLAGGDFIGTQQYSDFLTARMFRQTLLRRAGPVGRQVDPARVAGLYASGPIQPRSSAPGVPANLEDGTEVTFSLGRDRTVTLSDPRMKQALARIGAAFPGSVACAGLAGGAEVHEALLNLWFAGGVQFQVAPAPAPRDPGECPIASPLARLQAEQTESDARSPDHAVIVVSLDHNLVKIDTPLFRALLRLLDGARDRAALSRELQAAFGENAETSLDGIEKHLREAVKLGLLMPPEGRR